MDKEKVIIRSVRDSDVPALNAIRTNEDVVKNIYSIPTESERDTRRYFLEGGKDVFSLVAEDTESGKVVGYARLYIDAEPRRRHVGHLSMAVTPSQQGCGVGGMLMDSIIEIAKAWLGLIKLTLQVRPNNETAVRLYASRGFVEEGLMKMNFLVDGILVDTLIMSKLL